jgi:hypothetical protein
MRHQFWKKIIIQLLELRLRDPARVDTKFREIQTAKVGQRNFEISQHLFTEFREIIATKFREINFNFVFHEKK